MRYVHVDPDNEIVGNIIILGYFGPLFVNFFVNLIVILLFILRRVWASGVPRWLLITNFVFFIVQIVLLYQFNHPIQ